MPNDTIKIEKCKNFTENLPGIYKKGAERRKKLWFSFFKSWTKAFFCVPLTYRRPLHRTSP